MVTSVRVVSVGDFSKEFCGGTHVKNSGEIGLFKIVSESGVAAGIRRIEAVTGIAAVEYVEEKEKLIRSIESEFKCADKDIINKIEQQTLEIKAKEKEIAALKAKLAGSAEDEILEALSEVKDVKYIAYAVKDVDANSLRDLCDKVRNKIGEGVVLLGTSSEDKVQLVAMASKGVVSKGVHCGKLIKEVANICGGNGGGRPDMAQAGGKSPEKLEFAIGEVKKVLEKLVK